MTNQVFTLIIKCKQAYNKKKKHPSVDNIANWKNLLKQRNSSIRKAKRLWELSFIEQINDDYDNFWKIYNSTFHTSKSIYIPVLINNNNEYTNHQQEIIEILHNHFINGNIRTENSPHFQEHYKNVDNLVNNWKNNIISDEDNIIPTSIQQSNSYHQVSKPISIDASLYF